MKAKKIAEWKEMFFKEYYPKLIEKYSKDEIVKKLIKIIALIEKDPRYRY